MQEFALVILSIALVLQLSMGKTRLNQAGFFGLGIFLASVVAILGQGAFLSWKQYILWSGNELGQLLLPPYQSLDYFVFYSRARFFNPYIISMIFSLAILAPALYFNKKLGDRFFESGEPYILAAAIFLSGYPGVLFYLIFILAFGTLASGAHFLRFSHARRFSFYYLWLPAALFTIIISRWLAVTPLWQSLKL